MNKLSLSRHLYHGHGVPVNPMCVECDLFFTSKLNLGAQLESMIIQLANLKTDVSGIE